MSVCDETDKHPITSDGSYYYSNPNGSVSGIRCPAATVFNAGLMRFTRRTTTLAQEARTTRLLVARGRMQPGTEVAIQTGAVPVASLSEAEDFQVFYLS